MRQKNETATSFNQLKEITQSIQAHQAITQTSKNANMSEITSQSALTPKARARAKKGVLKPTKRAFSDRQISTIRDNSQASADTDKSQGSKQANKQGDNANAFKSDEAKERGQE
ncbi:hypothetical protein [Helicobacter pylori]|uniref:hypothetical protein n=1 Tax=Helicobacter pylori TaxID=210 RepID=UPI000EB07141|nr:hypothetical protein [Helicobacter pylori]